MELSLREFCQVLSPNLHVMFSCSRQFPASCTTTSEQSRRVSAHSLNTATEQGSFQGLISDVPGPCYSSDSMGMSQSNSHTLELTMFCHLPNADCVVLKHTKSYMSFVNVIASNKHGDWDYVM